MLHEQEPIDEVSVKPIVHVDSEYSPSATTSFTDEFHLLGIPITTIVQYIFNIDLGLSILCALSLIALGQNLIGLIFIGLFQFSYTIFGLSASIVFFNFGEDAKMKKQALLMLGIYVVLSIVGSVTLISNLIFWVVTGAPGEGGPVFLTVLILLHNLVQAALGGVMGWRMFVHLN